MICKEFFMPFKNLTTEHLTFTPPQLSSSSAVVSVITVQHQGYFPQQKFLIQRHNLGTSSLAAVIGNIAHLMPLALERTSQCLLFSLQRSMTFHEQEPRHNGMSFNCLMTLRHWHWRKGITETEQKDDVGSKFRRRRLRSTLPKSEKEEVHTMLRWKVWGQDGSTRVGWRDEGWRNDWVRMRTETRAEKSETNHTGRSLCT